MPDRPFSRNSKISTDRKFGEPPLLGKVMRSPDSAVARRGRSKTRRHKKHGIRVRAWTALLLIVTLSIILVMIASYVRGKSQASDDSSVLFRSMQVLDSAFSRNNEPELPSLSADEGLEIVNAAFANTEPARVMDFFIIDEKNDPQTVIESLMALNREEGAIGNPQWLGEKFIQGRILAQVLVSRGETQQKRIAQLAIGKDGNWRIDLDSYLRKVEPSWDTILSGKVEKSIVRVFIVKDSYYNGLYADETNWKAYRLESPDISETLFAYAMKDSPQQLAIDQIMSFQASITRVTLEITKKPGTAKRQFEISRVIAENWAIAGEDYDKAF